MTYRKIVLVAHSMGALVCRRALLMAVASAASWAPWVELVLFAPAQSGVRLTQLAVEMQGFVGRVALLVGGMRALSVATDALSQHSTFDELVADTRTAITHSPIPTFLIAKRVVFGSQEAVVEPAKRFCEDPCSPKPHFVVIPGKGHTSVCKPDDQYTDPLDIVVDFL
jgi:pimeloyl-ACP methyl ester carboxylesterase